MSCITSAAASPANMQTLQNAAKTLAMAKDDPWWDYPTIYKIDDESVSTNQGRENGILFSPPASFQTDFYLKQDVAAVPAKLRTIEGELNNPGGDFQFTPARIESIRTALQRAIRELDSALGTTAMNGGYGGRDTGMIPISYFATFTEIANIRYVRAQLATASNQVDQILSTLFSSDCNETEGDNCERIAAALEALAAKDFGGDVGPALEKIAAAVGADDLAAGVKVPRLVTEKDGGGEITLKSIPEFIRWQFLQMDALIGRFPLKIKAKDTEADETGEQEREYIAGNLSDAIASLIALAVTTETTADAALRGVVSACTEISSNRLLTIKSHAMLESLEEWASYTVKEETIDIPFSFDVEGRRLDEVFTAKKKTVRVNRWDGDRAPQDFDIEKIGRLINTCYAILMTEFGHRFDPQNPEAQFKQDLTAMQNTIDNGDEDDFSVWADRVEIEFSDSPQSRHAGETAVAPYGRPLTRRPRIKQIEGQGTEDIQEGENP